MLQKIPSWKMETNVLSKKSQARSEAGRRCRDTFATLKKTCRKLGVSFWAFLQDRLRGLNQIPRLAELIRQKAAEKQATKVEAVPG